MGTSGSYGGSAGRDWSELRQDLADWLDTLPGGPDETADDGSDETDDHGQDEAGDDGRDETGDGGRDETGDDGPDDENPPGNPPQDPRDPDPEVLRVLRPLRRAVLAGGAGSGGLGGGGTGGGGTGGGGRSPSGTGRSAARVGRVGGRLAAGVTGIRSGNAPGLLAIGLDLAELQALDPYRQAQRLLQAATEQGAATTLEEEELHAAASRTAIWALTEGQAPDVDEVIRRFIVEYVYEVFLTEGGAVLRGGERDGVAASAAEDRVRDTIVALVRSTPIDRGRLDATGLTNATERVLKDALQIHGTEM